MIFIYRDGDGILDSLDNCFELSNSDQADIDGDNIGISFQWLKKMFFINNLLLVNKYSLTKINHLGALVNYLQFV